VSVTTTRTGIPTQQRPPAADPDVAVPVAVAEAAARAGLRAVAAGEWPAGDGDELPGVAGFIVSSFNPLVVEVARRALAAVAAGAPPLPARIGEQTAVVVASAYGDAVSARAVAGAVDGGHRVGPLMFFQSVPNAVAGYVAARWGLTGPVVAVSPADAPASLAEGVEVARLLIADGDADRALVIVVEQGTGGAGDSGLAVLLEPASGQER
jgi:3-oxoacyl-(acyl-carrier-protein) synthase